jgi:acetyltransferase-like isoleucine patch superfamily enzyme
MNMEVRKAVLAQMDGNDMPFIHPTAFIHERAHVDGAFIGPRTSVWQFASVIRGTVIGEDCNITSGVLLDGCTMGDRCIVGQNCAIGPGFEIANDVFFGPNVTLCNDRWPAVSKEGFRPDLLRRGYVTIRIKDGASIGANAVLLPGVTIGKRAMVAAGAVVHCDVPDDYLFGRDGSIVKIKPEWRQRRMREAA